MTNPRNLFRTGWSASISPRQDPAPAPEPSTQQEKPKPEENPKGDGMKIDWPKDTRPLW